MDSILAVSLGEELFGIDSLSVEHILKVPHITKLPLVDNAIIGIATIGGRVVTIIDLALSFNKKPVDTSSKRARVVLVKNSIGEYGFIVSSVLEMFDLDDMHLEINEDKSLKLYGVYKKDDDIYQIINIDNVITSLKLLEFTPVEIDIFEQKNNNKHIENINNNDSFRAIFLNIGSEKLAISLDVAREIIFVPEKFTPISEAEYGVIGMTTLRDELITALDIRKLLSMNIEYSNKRTNQRLLVLSYKGKAIAFLVDSISEVKEINNKDIEKIPFVDSKIESVYKGDKDIVSILSNKYLKELIVKYSIEQDEDVDINEKMESEDMVEITAFKIANEEFAVGIEDIQEIIKYADITPIPEAPEFVKGVINLRGSVIAVLSLPKRLGFEEKITPKTKILICNIKDEKVGLLVDDVTEIMFVEDKYISKSTKEDSLFSDVVTIDDGKRVILKLRVLEVIDEEMLESIKMSVDK